MWAKLTHASSVPAMLYGLIHCVCADPAASENDNVRRGESLLTEFLCDAVFLNHTVFKALLTPGSCTEWSIRSDM